MRSVIRFKYIVSLVFILLFGNSKAQEVYSQKPFDLVQQQKQKGVVFQNYPLVSPSSHSLQEAERSLLHYEHIVLSLNTLHDLIAGHAPALNFSFSFNNEMITLELVKVNPLTSDFRVMTSSDENESFQYSPGTYYRGILMGDDHSIAAFSFFNNQFSGIVSSSKYGNLVIGKLAGQDIESPDYVIYDDRDFKSPHTTECATPENPAYAGLLLQNIQEGSSLRTSKCVRLYYEVDHDIYLQSGSNVTAAVDWMTAVHNEVAALFSNDDINTSLSGVFVWDGIDPYNGTYASDQLAIFKSQRPQFAGDLGQLVSIEPQDIGGVASNINGFCSAYDKYAYSEVDYQFNTVPVYSWTVEVIAHEFGHLMGSFHTHNCSWPGGAIDDCGPIAGYPNEGTCSIGPDPINGGTIMSYCHLTSFGINFSNGFGALPSAAMRGAINQSLCLTSDCTPIIPDYCASVGATSGEWIQSAQFGNYVNNSGAGNGYSDFTGQIINMPPDNVITFTFCPGYSGTHWTEYFSVWIDFNNDKDFFDPGENVYKSNGTDVPISGMFAIPKGVTGSTRMRVTMMFDELPGPCEVFNYGEVEDYTVNFSPALNYCTSWGTDASHEWIDYMQLGNVIRESVSDGGYFNGTSFIANASMGIDNYITYSAGMANNSHNEFWKLWIDYNHDGDFNDPDEKVFGRESASKKMLVRKFMIPTTALLGTTRMRLSMKRGDDPKPCEQFQFGEVEDYSINIVSQLPSIVQPSDFSASIYPNPVSNQLFIQFPRAFPGARIEMFNVNGELIMKTVCGSSETVTLKVESLFSGVYFIRVSEPGYPAVVKKFFKE